MSGEEEWMQLGREANCDTTKELNDQRGVGNQDGILRKIISSHCILNDNYQGLDGGSIKAILQLVKWRRQGGKALQRLPRSHQQELCQGVFSFG